MLFAPYALTKFGPHVREYQESPPARYCLDNGAWSEHRGTASFDPAAFRELVERLGPRADFVVSPDVVGGGRESLRLSVKWLPELLQTCRRVLIPTQDGLTKRDLRPYLGPRVGLFVGGSDEHKLGTLRQWGALASSVGCWLHVGRVNSARRIEYCGIAGADSFDGSGAARFGPIKLELYERARRAASVQTSLFSK